MKNRINQIKQGTIEYPVPAIRLIQDRIGQMVLPGKTVAAEVSVVSDNGIPMHLFFVSDDPRVTVPEQLTFGRSGKFTVEVSTKGLLLGEVLKGSIHILYNGGVLELPYEYPVVMAKNAEKEYAFVDFESFVRFYRSSRIEAAAVFSWDEFLDFPFMADMRLRALYHTFFHARSRDHGLSEFLKAAGVRNYEGEKAPDPFRERREELKEKALMEETSEEAMKLRLQKLVQEALLYQHKHPEGPVMEDPGFSDLIKDFPSEVLPVLALSWFCLKKNEIRQARDLLVGIQDPVQKARHEKKDIYCVFLYLVSQVQRNEERLKESIKLSRKYYQEGEFTRLLNFLVYHIDPEYEDLSRAATFLATSAVRHGADALLLQDLCFLFEKSTDGFDSLNLTVLQAMLFGLRNGVLSEKTLFDLLSLPLRSMEYLPLYMEVLKTGYRVHQNKELLQAVADILLQKKEAGEGFLFWYHEALYNDIRLPGLFEAYLKSQKKDPGIPLPRDLVLYINEHRDVKGVPCDVLFANVLAFYKQDEEVYQAYRNRILTYTLERMAAADYDQVKMPLYEEILDERFVDKSTADDMLQLLYVKKIRTSLPNMKRGVVHYGQIDRDYRTNLEEDTAYLPVYSDEAVVAFEDDHGIRYCDLNAEAEYVFDHEDLKKLCLLYKEDRLLSRLQEADNVIRDGVKTVDELALLEVFLSEKNIDRYYRNRVFECLTDAAADPVFKGVDFSDMLKSPDYASLSRKHRAKLLALYIEWGKAEEAYIKVRESGFEGLSDECLLKLSSFMIRENALSDEPCLLALCRELFHRNSAESLQLEYLSEHLLASPDEMASLVTALRKKKLPDSRLAEKTLLLCFYVRNTKYPDMLYEICRKDEDRDRDISDAYLILKAHDYFVKGKRIPENALKDLKATVFRLPKVGTIALLKLLSAKTTLGEEDRRLAESLLDKAAGENIVLGCFEKLEKKVSMPAELEGRIYVEYRDDDAKEIAVIGQILPDRRFFHRTLQEVYPGVFTRSFVLYKREWIEYYFVIRKKDGAVQEKEGSVIVQEAGPRVIGSCYDDITRLQALSDQNDLRNAAALMRTMVVKEAMIEDIFGEGDQ